MRALTVLASALLLAAMLLAWFQQARSPAPLPLTPSLTGAVEYCLTCHADLPQISSAHPVETFGCVRCHGGERLALDADLAHSSMRGAANPSDLAVAEDSCGGSDCHSAPYLAHPAPSLGAFVQSQLERDHIQRVTTSLQATYASAIAGMRFTFGAQPDLVARYGVRAVEADRMENDLALPRLLAFDPTLESSPPLQQFADNCLTCHLWAEPRPGPEYQRFTGCSACHTPTAGESAEEQVHILTLSMPYTQCNTCHNRGNYDLRSMQFVPRSDQPLDRLHDYYQLIGQFTRCEWTLDCIDCHTRQEAMGDGNLYSHKQEVQYTRCRTCHGTLDELPRTYVIQQTDELAMRLAFFNPVIDLQVGDTILVSEQGEPLWNTRLLADGSYELFGKATGQRFVFYPVMGSGCLQQLDQQESRFCHECHFVER